MSYFSDLEDDLDAAPVKRPAADVQKFPCPQCAGTGRWTGGINRNGEGKCFSCGGRGWFKTSEHDRRKARANRAAKKVRDLAADQAAFNEQHPGLIDDLSAVSSWNDFARDLVAKFGQYGLLTDPQVAAARRMLAKVAARKAERAQEAKAKGGAVDVSVIIEMFDTARGNGLKRPKFRYGDVILSSAPPTGRNPGAIYVTSATLTETDRDGIEKKAYFGKITDGQFRAVAKAPDDILTTLQDIAKNPRDAAVTYGRLTGSCSCCGRELTRKDSIEAGIGPICAAKWGI